MPFSQTLYPLSSVQREIWFDQSLTPEAPIYNIGGYHRIEGDFDPDAFRRAIRQLVQETDILRLRLCPQEDMPLQSFPEQPEIEVGFCDCRQAEDPLATALAAMQVNISRPFRLIEEPLCRHTLYRLAENTYIWSHVHHHLLIDGWAVSLIMQRVAALYHALRNGQATPPAPGVSYAEFVANDNAYLESAQHERNRQYWQQQFAPPPEPLFAVRSQYLGCQDIVAGPTHTIFLDRARYDRLGALAEAHSATLFHALISLLCVYFSRTGNRDECVIGLPVLNRTTPAFKQTIGLFASVIPVRFAVDRETSFSTLMQSAGKALRERYRHQRFPISEINRLAGVFETGRKSLFDLSLSFEQYGQEAGIGDQPLKTVALNSGFEQAPLSLHVREYFSTQDIQVDFSFNLAYFDPEEIGRISQRFLHLLDQALAAPDRPIGELDLLPPEERRWLLEDWNATTTPLPEVLAHQLFEAQTAKTPDATALVFENEKLTYAELNARANQLAHTLIALGVQPDERVAIALERSPQMIVALLAVLKAGGAFVPLDPEYPPERLAFMLEDAGAKILLTRIGITEHLSLQAARVICLDAEVPTLVQQAQTNPERPVAPHHLAYVIYTSGSTGKPKGVAIEQRGLPNLALAQSAAFGITPQSRVLQFASFSFDAAVSEIFMALCCGAALDLPNTEQRLPGLPLWQHLADNAITHVTLPPPALAVLPQTPLPELKCLIVAGEPCPPALAAFWSRDRRFFNAYGPTEITVCASIAECRDIDPASPLPIGRPLANTRLYVVDRHLQPTPIGNPGELCISGCGIARGYLNRPELTAEKFIANPFSNEPGARLYRTGDLVCIRPDGNLEFHGRIDDQVKIRGFRIELGEIENALTCHPAISEAIVVVSTDNSGDKRLIAHLLLHPAATSSPRELRIFLKKSLPDYMLPVAWVFHPVLPLTPNGKVDRKALLAPKSVDQRQKPQDALEEIIAGFWGALLAQPDPGIHDNFFELGGHSLIATRLASRLANALGISIPLRWVFETPTIATLAERIRSSMADNSAPSLESVAPAIPPVARDQPLPLSFAQQRLWFIDQFEGPSSTYNMPGTLELVGDLDRQALTAALGEIIRRHEVLRTRLIEGDDQPIQRIFPAEPLLLPYLDLRTFSNPDTEACRLADEEAARPFDLAADRPLRVCLLQRQDQAWTLLLTLHHSAADGWSTGILLNELAALYSAFRAGQPSPLPELAIQYADFALWQRNWFAGDRRQRQLEYWYKRLAGAPERLDLPTDRPRPARQSYRGSSISFMIEADLAAAANDFSRRSGSTLFMTLLAVWSSLLGRYSGKDDLVVGSPIANRTVSAIEPLIGFFVNTLALRADLSGNPSFNEVLTRIRRTCLEAYAHQDTPFESLVEALEIPRRLDHAPLIQVMFALQNGDSLRHFEMPGLQVALRESKNAVAKFDLTLSLSEQTDGFMANLEYATDLFNRESIEGMAQHYVDLLRSVLSHPENSVVKPGQSLPKALPEKCTDQSAEPLPPDLPRTGTAPPNNSLQELITRLWISLLHQPDPGIHDNFFELGGHSLLATRVASGLQKALGLAVPVRWIFEHPSIASLAERISAAMSDEHGASPVPPNRIIPGTEERITPDLLPLITLTQNEIDAIVTTVDGGTSNIQDIYSLTPLQEGILFHHQLQTVGDAYLSHSLLAFDSRARADAFLAAFQTVINRHDVLRTAFVWQGLSQPVQVVWRHASLPTEIRSFDPARGAVTDQLLDVCHPRHHRLDLIRPPLLRIVLTEDQGRWLMLFISHHLLMDHATIEVLLEEITACQRGEIENLPPPQPFRNYVHAAQNGFPVAEHEDFFRSMLADVEMPTAPFGLLDIQGDGSSIVEAQRDLPSELSQRLRSIARQFGATPAAICHLAWGLVLSRCCNQKDVVFGTVLLGRMQGSEGIEHAIGLFINTLPIRISCDERPVIEALGETQQRLLALMRHEHAALGLAQRCSAVPPPTPLFSSLLNFRHSTGSTSFNREGIELLVAEERSNYPFDLSIDDLGERFTLTAQVDVAVDPERVCAFMQQALSSLLAALDKAPQTSLCALDILPPAERRLLLADWNATAAPLATGLVHQCFEAQVARMPEATALVFENESLSYAELNIRANRLAHALIERGVQPDERVAIALQRSPEMIVALLAVLKAGGAFVPLDPEYPPERLQFMLEDSGAKILLTSHSHARRNPGRTHWIPAQARNDGTPDAHACAQTLCLDAETPLLSRQPECNPDYPVAPHHLAYIIYTSGSTGKPKGVMIEHDALATHCRTVQSQYQLTSVDRVCQFASFSFDTAIEQILPSLITGASLFLPPPGLLATEVFDACLRRAGVTVLCLPPAFFLLWSANSLPPPAHLRLVLLGGDALPPEVLSVRSNWPKPWLRLCNAYGPTETTITATLFDIPENWTGTSVPIGSPLPGRRLYVLDRYLQPLPIGVAGELHIGGAGLARGYLNRPDLTAEKIIADPFCNEPGARLYKTGDLARYRPDGTLEFLGRIDNQVKIRGFRIELGEIEAALTTHPDISETIVLNRSDEGSESLLVAYVVCRKSHPATSDLRTFLKSSLPDYMLPAAFVFLAALPLTHNGKIDRKALPAPEEQGRSKLHEPPRDALEKIIASLWEKILRHPNPGLQDNFFELGGHSLIATQLTSQLHSALGLSIPVRLIFEAPTLRQFAKCIRAAMTGEPADSTVPANRITPETRRITPELLPLVSLTQDEIDDIVATVEGGVSNIEDIYPLTPLQEGILFHHQLQTIGDAYLYHALLAFDSRAQIDTFLAALQSVINRHDVLRTAVVWQGLTSPIQVVWRQATLPVEILHFDPAAGPVVNQLLESCRPHHTRLDLTRPPLLRMVLAEDRGRWLVLFFSHHMIADHTSAAVLHEEVAKQRQGVAQAPPLHPFRNFVHAARNGVSAAEHEAFFSAMLADMDTPTAPFGLLDIQGDGQNTTEACRTLPAELAQRLRATAQRLGSTPAILSHLAWALVLARCCNQEQVVFGTVLFGRMQGGEGIERALGLFINALPIRIACDDDPVIEALRGTQRRLLALMRHEHASLGLAQRCSAVQAPTPLFSSLFNYRHSLGGLMIAPEGAEFLLAEERSNYPFDLSVDDLGDGFMLTASVDASVDPDRICAFMQQALSSLVTALDEAPQTPLCALNILPPAEKQQLLTGWDSTARNFADERKGSSIPIDLFLPGCKFYVLDRHLQPLPIGVTGTLFIGSHCLTPEYLTDSERFSPDPFSKDPAARLYRSDDLVRYRTDGTLEFLARIDRRSMPASEAPRTTKLHESPRDAIEQTLAVLWEKLLNHADPGRHDNFFELGGHSLLSIRLVSEIRKAFDHQLPVSQFFAHPTIAGLANLIRDQISPEESTCLVRIRASGSCPPFFFLPGAGGMVSYLYPLAQALDPEIPFFTFQAQGLEGSASPHACIKEMAEHYLRLLLEVQPHGPYHLGGHSIGGLVAFAMAQDLLNRGEEIGLLAVVDSCAPGLLTSSDSEADAALLLFDIAQILAELGQQKLPLSEDDLAGLDMESRINRIASCLETAQLLPQGSSVKYLRALLKAYQAHSQAALAYSPAPDPLPPVTLFRASAALPGRIPEPELPEDLGWELYSCQPVAVTDLPGNHLSMMTKPNVMELAKALQTLSAGKKLPRSGRDSRK